MMPMGEPLLDGGTETGQDKRDSLSAVLLAHNTCRVRCEACWKQEKTLLSDKDATPQTLLMFAAMFLNTIAKIGQIVGAVVLMAAGFAAAANAQAWGEPVWSDEFDSSEGGAAPDASKWTFDVGGSGWGNHELEVYCAPGTSSPALCDGEHPNAFQDGHGHLIIRGLKVSAEPAHTGSWTSARLKTLGLKDFQYGRMESCIKLPVGAGLWPAFWMLGTAGKWPAGGEIDIMENIPESGGSGAGLGPQKIQSTIHGPSTVVIGRYSLGKIFTFPVGQRIDDSTPPCHAYGAIWSPFMLQMYVDDWRKPFFIRTASDVPAGGRWVFNAPFYFLLNLAVGGDWPGPPNSATPSPAEMTVDYVRVYKANRVDGPMMTAPALRARGEAASSTILELRSTVGTGFVFLACELEGSDSKCSVDTGNALNASVADFRSSDLQRANITVRHGDASARSDPGGAKAPVMITAYTVSGEQSIIAIPIE
jgi:beta-glucanase (GH16 family)